MIKRFISCFALSKQGFDVENLVHQNLINNQLNTYREKEIKRKYGMNISGIDHLFSTHHFKTNDIQYVLIQTKYKNKPISISDCHHFIKCCYDIYDFEKKFYKMTCIMLSKNGLSRPSKQSFNQENNKQENLNFVDLNGEDSGKMIYKLNLFLIENDLMFSTKNKKRKLSPFYFNHIIYSSCKKIKFN